MLRSSNVSNRDIVAGRDEAEVDGMLGEHTGQTLVHVANEVEMNVGGQFRMHAHIEDNIIMAGAMRDEFAGGTFVTAATGDDMAAGVGLRCTAALDVWMPGWWARRSVRRRAPSPASCSISDAR